MVAVSREFLEQNPEVGLQTGSRHFGVEPGRHFGSRHPGTPQSTAIYDFIPDALLGQVANAEQFLASLVFDRWVANADGRQSIFFRAQLKDWLAQPGIPPRKMGFVALMIDHGFAFNGPHWDFPESVDHRALSEADRLRESAVDRCVRAVAEPGGAFSRRGAG